MTLFPEGSALPATRRQPVRRAADVADMFARQHTPTVQLPDPVPLMSSLAMGAFEVIDGVREIEQLARWLAAPAYRDLLTRANLASRARSARNVPARRRQRRIVAVRHSSPADGVAEGVVVVTDPVRARAVAVRLEGLDRRWRAAALAIL